MNPLDVAFLGFLVYRNRELLPVLQEHLQDQEDQLLPYLLLADIMRWMITDLAQSADTIVVRRILKEFERRFEEEEDLQTLIVCGFLENLPYPDEQGAELLTLLGPSMKAYLSRMR